MGHTALRPNGGTLSCGPMGHIALLTSIWGLGGFSESTLSSKCLPITATAGMPVLTSVWMLMTFGVIPKADVYSWEWSGGQAFGPQAQQQRKIYTIKIRLC